MNIFHNTTKLLLASALAIQFFGGGLGQAATVELTAIDSGWWNNSGNHGSSNTNYFVGKSGSTRYRNFLVFDLSGITESITSATLQLYNPSNGFSSVNPHEVYSLYDVSTAISALTTSGTGQTGIYNDLGTGTSYGNTTVSADDNGDLVEVVLNPDGISSLNGATGEFAFGGALTSIGSGSVQRVFAWTHLGNPTRKLILETLDYQTSQPVPEPSTFFLMGSGFALILSRRFNKSSIQIQD